MQISKQLNSANVAKVLNQPCGTDIASAATYMPLIEIRYVAIIMLESSHNIHGYYGILSIRTIMHRLMSIYRT